MTKWHDQTVFEHAYCFKGSKFIYLIFSKFISCFSNDFKNRFLDIGRADRVSPGYDSDGFFTKVFHKR